MRGVVTHSHVTHHTDVPRNVRLQYAGVFGHCPRPPWLRVLPPKTTHPWYTLARHGVLRDASGASPRSLPALLCALLARAQSGPRTSASGYGGTPDSDHHRCTLFYGVPRPSGTRQPSPADGGELPRHHIVVAYSFR